MSGNPSPLMLTQPLDIDDARLASRRLADQRRAAEQDLERLTKDAAEKEAAYRLALAHAFVDVDGRSAEERKANAYARVTAESYERDLAAGMVKVQAERLRGLEGERSMLKSLVEWSMRIGEEQREQLGRQARAA